MATTSPTLATITSALPSIAANVSPVLVPIVAVISPVLITSGGTTPTPSAGAMAYGDLPMTYGDLEITYAD